MITRLKLLQTKYSLSNEFIINAIRAEIERQALLDIKGIISNCSIGGLEHMASKFTQEPINGIGIDSVVVDDTMANASINSHSVNTAPVVVAASINARKGKRRG